MVFAETSVISLSVAFTFLVYACEYYTQGGSVIGPSIEWNIMGGSTVIIEGRLGLPKLFPIFSILFKEVRP